MHDLHARACKRQEHGWPRRDPTQPRPRVALHDAVHGDVEDARVHQRVHVAHRGARRQRVGERLPTCAHGGGRQTVATNGPRIRGVILARVVDGLLHEPEDKVAGEEFELRACTPPDTPRPCSSGADRGKLSHNAVTATTVSPSESALPTVPSNRPMSMTDPGFAPESPPDYSSCVPLLGRPGPTSPSARSHAPWASAVFRSISISSTSPVIMAAATAGTLLATADSQTAVPAGVLFDAHCHLQDARLDGSRDALFARAAGARVAAMAVNATGPGDWAAVLSLAAAHPGVVPSLGVHPLFCVGLPDGWAADLRALLLVHERAGVGEAGLDRSAARGAAVDFDLQLRVCRAQLALARELRRPVSLHCVRAHEALRALLEEAGPWEEGQVLLHSYGGSAEMVPVYASLGCYFSFSGWVTQPRKRARTTLRALAVVPRDRLLVESDAPDQTPVLPAAAVATGECISVCAAAAARGADAGAAAPDGDEAAHGPPRESATAADSAGAAAERDGAAVCAAVEPLNEPAYMVYTIEAMASALGCPPLLLAEQCARNAARVFRRCTSNACKAALGLL